MTLAGAEGGQDAPRPFLEDGYYPLSETGSETTTEPLILLEIS